ncbi:MAG: hypothetical protein UT55_C0084G0003 [Candidatus Peregrinibacteria bacterium GW2011_GWE2_39_6]|nr:MAG: hypothetical protein UT36_C0001G0129 [Candidatus Peregrinibacteria bacterium GW2011_GWF2_39_17]KKR23694.1 MAG: hypothetical protein UT55_C0084G0003 [Candidatus Peregrinibacteria bacterium GW2011_GWE2_39_6]HCW32567.1 hypothetical protein [Candidatus Peregrinibacteria bacterium]
MKKTIVKFTPLISLLILLVFVLYKIIFSSFEYPRQCGAVNPNKMSSRVPIYPYATSLTPDNAKSRSAEYIVDKNLATFAYPNQTKMGYLVDLINLYPIRMVEAVWKDYGIQDIYITQWVIDGCNEHGQWVILGQGGFPNSQITTLKFDPILLSQIRVRATGPNNAVLYELQFE